MNHKTITLALTGASGMGYAMRLLQTLLDAGHRVYLVYSRAAQFVTKQELDLALPNKASEAQALLIKHYGCLSEQLQVFSLEDWFAPIASGTGTTDAMVICPCTMGTLSAVANGASDNLIERAADVMIKENRKLIIVPRETPLSPIHLENMFKLSRIGVTILSANPGYYHQPKTIQDIIDFIVAKILDQLDIEHTLLARWGETEPHSGGGA